MWKAGLVALAALFAASTVRAQPPVWVVKDHDSEIVLFGSVHVLPPGVDWEPPALGKALGDADDLWFELPMDPATQAETAALAGQRGVLPPNKSLFKMLGAKDAARLSRVAAAYDVSPALLDHLQPWLAEFALASGVYKRSGAGADDGVEKAIAAAAPAAAQRRAFETPAEQIALFADAPQAEQLASLRQTIQEMEDKPDEFAVLVRAWMAGDLTALEREALEPLRKASPGLFRRVVTERNARWAQMLQERMKGHGRTVVVVGMGHLIGPDGVPARLRALGYSVQGP